MDEIWKDIIGYEGKYRVSSHGRVFSVNKNVIMKGQPNKKDGYIYVTLSDAPNRRPWKAKVHRLVGLNFIEIDPARKYIDHINGDKHNNHVTNLRWVTFQENITAAWETGMYTSIGVNHPQAKFTEDQVRDIKRRLLNKQPASKIAQFYGCKMWPIYDIKQGRTWGHIKLA